MVNENEVITIKLDDIIPNRFQPREVFDEQSMQELADSIKIHGVIQPIIVRPVGDKYEIIAGERRYKASVMAGKIDIPALVRNKDDKDSSIIAFIENSQRKNVSAIEEAKTCERLLLNNDLTQEQLAKQLGMSQSTLANKLRLLTLPIEVQEALLHGEISERHGRSLLTLKDTKAQLNLLERIKEEKLTVRELDGVIKNMIEEPNKDGLYNLPGSDDAKEAEALASQNNTEDGGMDFSRYENLAPVDTPAPQQEAPASNQFLDFLNNFEAPEDKVQPAEIVQETPAVPTPEMPAAANTVENQDDGAFLDFLNNFETSVPEVPAEENPVAEAPQTQLEAQDNQFLTFLNNFEVPEDKAQPETTPAAPEVPAEEPKVETPVAPVPPTSAVAVEPPKEESSDVKKFDDFLSSFNSGIAPAAPQATPAPETPKVEVPVAPATSEAADNDFLAFLNKFDESPSTPEAPEVPAEEPKVETPVETETQDNDFLAFLNKFDENPTTSSQPTEAKVEETKVETPQAVATPPAPTSNLDAGFAEFLKRYEAPAKEPVDLGPVEELKEKTTVNESQNIAETMDVNAKYLNPIEEVAPKVEYVENSPNYVDVTKPISYDSVDSIIGKLKVVTDEIKKSKYKITTEETDFDDVYTITIKIDKRNFL